MRKNVICLTVFRPQNSIAIDIACNFVDQGSNTHALSPSPIESYRLSAILPNLVSCFYQIEVVVEYRLSSVLHSNRPMGLEYARLSNFCQFLAFLICLEVSIRCSQKLVTPCPTFPNSGELPSLEL